MKNIANIINFVRAVEPREKDNSYLPETTRKELELCRRYSFRSTVLLQYDALILPVTDGYRFSSPQKRAGIYPLDCSGKQILCDDYRSETDDENQKASCCANGIEYIFTPERITIHTEKAERFVFDFADNTDVPYKSVSEKELFMKFSGTAYEEYSYSVRLDKGFFEMSNGKPVIIPENGTFTIITER